MPLPLLAAAPEILQGLGGLAQTIFGGSRAHKAQQQLENLQSPTYTPSQGIGDYYTKALQRYNQNPFQSAQYQQQQNQIQRNFGSGLNALQGRRSAIAGVSRLAGVSNDASLKSAATAEQQQGQQLSQLGQAAGAQAQEQQKAYQYNQLMPYQTKMGLLAQKAAAGSQTMNAGLSNIFGATSTIGQMGFQDYLSKKYFGDQNQTNGQRLQQQSR